MDTPLEYLIKSCSEASSRSRSVLVFFCFSGLIAFIAYHNSRQDAWQAMRYQHIMEVRQVMDAYSIDSTRLNKKTIDSLEIHATDMQLRNACEYLAVREIYTKSELDTYEKIFANIREKSYTVQVPILGISFDINDLGLFTGLTFMLILLVFCFCLEREQQNIEHTLYNLFYSNSLVSENKERGTPKYLKYYFDQMCMTQVMTITPNRNGTVYAILMVFSKLPYVVGLLVMVMIYYYDIQSRAYGTTVSNNITTYDEYHEEILLFINFVLTIICIAYGIRIDLIWNKYQNKLFDILEQPTQK